ncbi:TF29 [Hepatospora eriocheir]|uniref:RNA-directed DNA polymerase n=1 Tax=Hepatospora eriocheir TaxID=1081669 RepID=A0A1X0QKI8_9MICR|nr:TF29 [Hepatospora eriocheir]
MLEADVLLIQQDNYYLIEDYYTALTKAVKPICYIRSLNNTQSTNLINDYFMRNLSLQTKLELSKLKINSTNEAINFIKQQESMIIFDYNNKKLITPKEPNKPKQEINNNKKKYRCAYHKMNGHTTEECEKLKKIRAKELHSKPEQPQDKRNTDNSKTYSFKEIRPKIDPITLQGRIHEHIILILLDTGSQKSYISKTNLDKLGLPVKTIEPVKTETADKREVVINTSTTFDLQFINIPNSTYTLTTYILPTTGVDMILGTDLLVNFNAVLDYQNCIVKLDNHEIEMLPSYLNDSTNNPDQIILEKSKIYVTSTDITTNNLIPESVKQLLLSTLNTNPILGNIKITKHKICLTSQKRFKIVTYKVPYAIQESTNLELQRLIQLGVIRKSESDYISPAFVSVKSTGKIRLIVDFRELNKLTEKIPYPIPSMNDLLITFKNSKYYTTLDLNMGYYQIEMEQNSIKYTSFILNGEQYEFTRMPFGLQNAPMTFQKAMNRLLSHLQYIKVYLDDIIIYSKTLEEHHIHITEVINILTKNQVSVNFNKSKFYQTEIKYLGHIISENGIKPDISKVTELTNIKQPRSRKDLQRLLGFINWFRNFIPNLSQNLKPITDKLKQSNFKWIKKDQEITQNITNQINHATLLNYPNFDKDFTLQCDASDTGIGSILTQENKTIGYFSAKLSNSQTNYTIMEKEAYAIIRSLEHFKYIIFGNKVHIKTDNANIIFDKFKDSKRILRWKYLLNEYDYQLTHLEGKANICADFLSRLYTISILPKLPHHLLKEKDVINTSSNLRVKNLEEKIQIPNSNTNLFIKNLHEELGHPGATKLYETIKRYYTHPQLSTITKQVCSRCILCQKHKITNTSKVNYQSFHYATEFNQKLCSDIFGPIKTFEFKTPFKATNFYIITIIDVYSRLVQIEATKLITSNEIIKSLSNWIKNYGSPENFLSDRGRQYTSTTFQNYCKSQCINLNFTTGYSPQSNGISERINQTIANLLRIYKDKDINTILDKIRLNLNHTTHSTTGLTPFEILNHFSPIDPIKRNLSNFIKKEKILHKVKETRSKDLTNQSQNQLVIKAGDEILLKNQTPNKLSKGYDGPYTVREVNEPEHKALIEFNNKTTWESLRNIKKFIKQGEDVTSSTNTHETVCDLFHTKHKNNLT